jgi:hypothetical protein
VRAQRKGSPAFSEAVERRGNRAREEKEGEVGEGADAWVQLARERGGRAGRQAGLGGKLGRGSAHAGEKEERAGPRAGERKRGGGRGFWAGWLGSFLLLFFFYTPLIQTKLFEFKYNLNSNLYTQHK